MRKSFLFLAIFSVAVRILAQTNPPVKLALISETDETLTAADLLTAKFSGNDRIQLLERDQIEKVYREQGLSAANTDYLKLGHVLGADGLLLLNVVRAPQTTNLMARLIAVKPGVILSDAGFSWPLKDTAQWTDSAAAYLNAFLPKLTVLPKDAIPISVVNLRSAINSTAAAETERQLKLLVIQRLSQERQLFVLERQKMQLLSDEKELKADDSAFWDGSYLLEGVVDQNGYSPDTVTINARLTPPKGGAPVLFVASGNRTNLTEVINQLVVKVNDALKIQATAPVWNAADEAAQFFKEANWAMRWGLYSEAQSAADSAWALGKQDTDCVRLRIQAYMVSPDAGQAMIFYPARTSPDPQIIKSATHALEIYNEVSHNLPPEEPKVDSDWYQFGLKNLIVASRVLQAFNESPDYYLPVADELAGLRAAARLTADWISKSPSVHDSYYIGDRVAVYDGLYHFEESPSLFSVQLDCGSLWQDKPEDSLVIYRQLLSSPVFAYLHERFWFRDLGVNGALPLLPPRLIAWNEADQKRIPALWNGFRQELNDSTNLLWQLEAKALCVADATNETEMAGTFTNFFNAVFDHADELVGNPVEILYLEWRTGELVERMGGDAYLKNKESLEQVYASQYRPKLKAMDHQYEKWAAGALKAEQFLPVFKRQMEYLQMNPAYDLSKFTELFGQRDYSLSQAQEIRPLAVAYQSNLLAQAAAANPQNRGRLRNGATFIGLFLINDVDQIIQPPGFESQRQYLQEHLRENQPFDYLKLTALFRVRDYTQNQARELFPLVVAYQSNLTVEAALASDGRGHNLRSGIGFLNHVTNSLARILNPSAPQSATVSAASLSLKKPASMPVAEMSARPVAITNAPEIITNAIAVETFFAIPTNGLPGDLSFGGFHPRITAHHWFEGKLLLDFEYGACFYQFDEQGNWKSTRNATLSACALLDPVTGHWDVVSRPEVDMTEKNNSFYRSVLWQHALFTSDGGKIQKYNPQSQQWATLAVSDGNNYELFVVNGRLYGANGNAIFEIINDGKEMRLMASARRQPAVSVLDTEDFGTPALFAGPDGDLRVSTQNKIFTWSNDDWREICAAPPTSFSPAIFPDAVLFQGDGWNVQPAQIAAFTENSKRVELFLRKTSRQTSHVPPSPLWKLPPQLSLPNLSASVWRDDLSLMADPSNISPDRQPPATGKKTPSSDGYNAVLFCFSRNLPSPQKIFLNFDATKGCPPPAGMNANDEPVIAVAGVAGPWMLFTPDFLICGQETLGPDEGSLKGDQTGVWLIPVSKIEPAIAAQKKSQQAQLIQAAAAAEQTQKDRFAKYDLNHNGVIDPDEREAALDDPEFIAWQLELIDLNHNGQLDLEELAYFDANQNKILESKEQAGIEIAQHLLAEKNMQTFDADENGFLDQNEFMTLWDSGFKNGPDHSTAFIMMADRNRDGKIDRAELEDYLNRLLFQKLHPPRLPGSEFIQMLPPRQSGRDQAADELFKSELESYWRNPDSLTKRPRIRHLPPVQ